MNKQQDLYPLTYVRGLDRARVGYLVGAVENGCILRYGWYNLYSSFGNEERICLTKLNPEACFRTFSGVGLSGWVAARSDGTWIA